MAGRFAASSGKSQLRFAGSGSHSPPRWRNARAPMRSITFPSFLHPGWRCVPALRKRRAFEDFGRPNITRPSGKNLTELAGRGLPLRANRHHTRIGVFLRNLLKITRNGSGGQFFRPQNQPVGPGRPLACIRARYTSLRSEQCSGPFRWPPPTVNPPPPEPSPHPVTTKNTNQKVITARMK